MYKKWWKHTRITFIHCSVQQQKKTPLPYVRKSHKNPLENITIMHLFCLFQISPNFQNTSHFNSFCASQLSSSDQSQKDVHIPKLCQVAFTSCSWIDWVDSLHYNRTALGWTHSRRSLPHPSAFYPHSPVRLTSVIAMYHTRVRFIWTAWERCAWGWLSWARAVCDP